MFVGDRTTASTSLAGAAAVSSSHQFTWKFSTVLSLSWSLAKDQFIPSSWAGRGPLALRLIAPSSCCTFTFLSLSSSPPCRISCPTVLRFDFGVRKRTRISWTGPIDSRIWLRKVDPVMQKYAQLNLSIKDLTHSLNSRLLLAL